jgi:hypothetical protein
MKVVTQQNPILQLVPRYYPSVNDELILDFENGIIVPFTWILNKNLIVITITDTSFLKQRENYSFTLYNSNEIIYKGKIIFLKNGTDIQNYTNNSQDNKRWQ